MNSNCEGFDWHKPGLYLAVQPNGELVFTSAALNAYSCRAELIREVNLRWSALKAEGWVIQAFAAKVLA